MSECVECGVTGQGESDVVLAGAIESGVVKTADDTADHPIETPQVPQNQPTGRYTTTGETDAPGVTVQTPRVTTLDVLNSSLTDIAGGTVSKGDDTSGAGSEKGQSVTIDGVNRGGGAAATEVLYPIDLSDTGTGTYTISLAGTDDLDFGEASQSTTITVTGDDNVTLDLESETVTRGEDVTYTIRGSSAGAYHIVTIESGDFRDPDQAASVSADIFRNVGDTVTKGYNSSDAFAYAVIQNRRRYWCRYRSD